MGIFAKRLRETMSERHMTQAELSSLTGIGRSGISMYLSGKNKPGLKYRALLAEKLNVAEEWLTGETEEPDSVGGYSNIPVETAAKLMDVSPQFIRIGLQLQRLPFGYALKMRGSRFTYYISPKKFQEYTGIEFESG